MWIESRYSFSKYLLGINSSAKQYASHYILISIIDMVPASGNLQCNEGCVSKMG